MRSPRCNIEKKLYDIKPPAEASLSAETLAEEEEKAGGFGVPKSEIKATFVKDDIKNESDFKAVSAYDNSFTRDAPVKISQSVYKKSTWQSNRQAEKRRENEFKDDDYYEVEEPEIKNKFNFKILAVFLVVILILASSLLFLFYKKGVEAKGNIIKNSASAYENIVSAQKYLKNLDFKNAGFEFSEAHKKFSLAQKEANSAGASVLGAFLWLPFSSEVNSSNNLINVGVQLSYAGKTLSEAVEPLLKISSDSVFKKEGIKGDNSFGVNLASMTSGIEKSKTALKDAEISLKEIDPYDFPEDLQKNIWELKNKFPDIKNKVDTLSEYSDFVLWFLGEDNPKKFLIVSQNTSEARATGGFLGSYGLLSSEFGYIKDIFMDDIYNLDGQLSYKAIPPRPIQKISTAWSTHDANWFLDFPTSAKKIAFFYEKAGGPTPDGVIAINEKVIERILRVVGSVNMPEYGVVLNADNFVDTLQYEIEKNYDKTINRPKKILDDMLPKLFEKFSDLSQEELTKVFNVFVSSLDKKDILIWANQPKRQKFVLQKGWGGEVLKSDDSDYLAVVSSNINGFKTDRVIDQKITKITKVEEDGSIINTVKIKRIHNGGGEEYEWLNKVNSSYLRVYVPLGSELLDASGYTNEKYEAPIDYKKAGFKSDEDVFASVNSSLKDEKTKTDIFKESGKTVFGNWVYVSPGEEVEVSYTYKPPFKLNKNKKGDDLDFIFQAQPGVKSELSFDVVLPEGWGFIYSLPERSWGKFRGVFDSDKFFSVGVGY